MRTLVLAGLLALVLPLSAGLLLADDEAAPSPAPKKPAVTPAEIDRLIAQLGADDFRTREAASRKLEAAGEAAREALEKAARTSDSPEVRWRADQLLRRLGGGGERPLGAEDGRKPAPTPDDPRPEDPFERLRRWFSEFSKRLDGQRKGDPFGPMPWGPLSGPRRVEVPGLVLERLGPGLVRLRVKKTNEAGAEVENIYSGHSLKDILHRNPDLARHPGMNELKRREAEQSWPGFDDFLKRHFPRMRIEPGPGGRGGFSLSTSQGVEIVQDADGVTVRIKEKDENGKEQVKEYKGKSIEQLKRDHPELKDKIGGFGLSLRVHPPQIWWGGRPRERLKPLRPSTPTPPPTPQAQERALFGLTLTAPDEALASHLKLEGGAGAQVVTVVPGSQAARMGLERNDIIVKVDGEDVDLAEATARLRKAAAEKAPLAIQLIRRGEDMTLTR